MPTSKFSYMYGSAQENAAPMHHIIKHEDGNAYAKSNLNGNDTIVASCTTFEAAVAAGRLLSGECIKCR